MLPRSRFECPRCGFGVRPGEEQCDRCGEDLNPKEKRPLQVSYTAIKLNRSSVEDCSNVRIRSIEPIAVARPDTSLQFKIDDLERREKALREKERRLTVLAEGLEERTQKVEPSKEGAEPLPARSDMDELRQKIREDLIRQFQPELEALQEQLEVKEAELSELMARHEALEGGEGPQMSLDEGELARMTEEIFQELKDQLESPPPVKDVGILRTSISKLDDILGGGIPQGHTVLFNGAPGTMKSTLVYTILYRSALLNNVNGLYLSIEQNRRSILRQMERMNMPLSATEGRLKVADLKDLREEMAEEQGNWRELLLSYVRKVQNETGFSLFVLDSLESFKAVTEHSFTRQDLKDLFDWFKSLGITVFVVSENISDEWDEANQGEAYLSDGILELLMREMSDSKVQRWLRCVKMRGVNADSRYYSMFHDGKEFNMSLPLANQPF